MLDGEDTEKYTFSSHTNSREKFGETSSVREATNEEGFSNVQLVAASVPADADTAKSRCGEDDGRREVAEVEEVGKVSSGDRGTAVPEEGPAGAEVKAGAEQRASAARALLSLAAKGALVLVAADVLVGRPLQYVASITVRFWAVGFIMFAVLFLTAASIGIQWRRQSNIQPAEVVTGGSLQEEQLVGLQIPTEDQQTAEAPFLLKSSHKVKQSICEDIVPHKSSDKSSEFHLVRSLNDNAIVV